MLFLFLYDDDAFIIRWMKTDPWGRFFKWRQNLITVIDIHKIWIAPSKLSTFWENVLKNFRWYLSVWYIYSIWTTRKHARFSLTLSFVLTNLSDIIKFCYKRYTQSRRESWVFPCNSPIVCFALHYWLNQ